MKTISVKPMNGKRRIVLELEANEVFVVLRNSAHYKLAEPHCDIVHVDRLIDAHEVLWCDVAQQWVGA